MTARALMLSILLSGAWAGFALADDRGSQADQDACTPDVFRLCSAFIPNEDPIVGCLKSKRDQLTPACRHVFFSDPPPPPPDATPTEQPDAPSPSRHSKPPLHHRLHHRQPPPPAPHHHHHHHSDDQG